MTLGDRSQNLALKIQMSALVSFWCHLCLTQETGGLKKLTPAMQKKKKNDVPRLLSVIVTTSYAHVIVQ